MLKERSRFEKEVELLTGGRNDSIEKLNRSEREEIESRDPSVESLEIRPKPPTVRGRILWPALGFPSVISPMDGESTSQLPEGDATRCICILLLCDKEGLSEGEASRYLRYIPWEKRHFSRHIRYVDGREGIFSGKDLRVLRPQQGGPTDRHGELIVFGANRKGENGILASLAKSVRQSYRNWGLEFMYEIRVNESTSRRLANGLYHLFWNNESENDDVPSDEMKLLIDRFGIPRRKKLGKQWMSHSALLKNEYEFEYGSLHIPYKLKHGGQTGRRFRTEILHPLFIRKSSAVLRIGHLTDTHVDVRADVYEENLKQGGIPQPILDGYHNWNKRFLKIYNKAKSDSDLLIMTGDLIDYGRGFIGVERRQELADNDLYNSDRNWFLFYYLLASNLGFDNSQYSVPVYTSLGNHDWRLNPYPPFAFAGAPSPLELFDVSNPDMGRPAQLREYLKYAHGKGHDLLLSYDKKVILEWQRALEVIKDPVKTSLIEKIRIFYPVAKKVLTASDKILSKLLKGDVDRKGFPTETNVESVEWYLLSINPFLNYQFAFPGGYKLLMLDWEKDENVLFSSSDNGKMYSFGFSLGAPRARNCLTTLQKKLVEALLKTGGKAKIVGIHSPPIGPWPDWYDDELLRGWNEFKLGGRGYQFYRAKLSDGGKTVQGHPVFAIRPKKGPKGAEDAVYGMDAVYGSFENGEKRRGDTRDWFIRQLADQKYQVRLVLSGHIHRQGYFITYKMNVDRDSSLFNELLIKSIDQGKVVGTGSHKFGLNPGPLYVNGTSVGPRGYLYRSKDQATYIPGGYTYIEILNNGSVDKVALRLI